MLLNTYYFPPVHFFPVCYIFKTLGFDWVISLNIFFAKQTESEGYFPYLISGCWYTYLFSKTCVFFTFRETSMCSLCIPALFLSSKKEKKSKGSQRSLGLKTNFLSLFFSVVVVFGWLHLQKRRRYFPYLPCSFFLPPLFCIQPTFKKMRASWILRENITKQAKVKASNGTECRFRHLLSRLENEYAWGSFFVSLFWERLNKAAPMGGGMQKAMIGDWLALKI